MSMQDWQKQANEIQDDIMYFQDELSWVDTEEAITMYLSDIADAEIMFNVLLETIEAHGGTFERIET